MKKKQFMSKLAALTMAAMMGATMLPATAIPTMAAAVSMTSDSYPTIATADANYYPTQSQLETALQGLSLVNDTTDSSNTDINSTLRTALCGAVSQNSNLSVSVALGGSWSSYSVSGTDVTMPTIAAKITIANSDAPTNKTGFTADYTLTAAKLTDADAVAAFKDYVVNYINAKMPTTRGTSAVSDFKTNIVDNAVSDFATLSGVTVTATPTANFTNGATGTDPEYSIAISSGGQSANATGSVTFFTSDQVTVESVTNGNDDDAEALKAKVMSQNLDPSLSAGADGSYNTIANQTAVKNALGGLTGYSIQDVVVSGANNWSFEAYNANATYKVTINTATTLESANSALKTALDNYFDSTTIEAAKNKTLTNAKVAELAYKALTDAGKLPSGWNITGDGHVLGDNNTVKLTVTKTTSPSASYDYTHTAIVETKDKTDEEANSEALAAVNSKTYPDYHLKAKTGNTAKDGSGAVVTHDEAWLQQEITADLKTAGYDVDSVDFVSSSWTGSSTAKKATATGNGNYKVVINNKAKDVINVVLTYSSDQKSKDTNDSLLKVLKVGSEAGTDGTDDVRVTEHAADEDPVSGNSYQDVDGSKVYEFDETSGLSTAIQSKSAVKATTTADAIKVVEDKINTQLKNSGVDTNGVKVSVTAVNVQNADKSVSAGQADATAEDTGKITLLVKTSIKNDFYGNEDKLKNLETNYVLDITTNKLKANAVKSISLSDKTTLLTNGYYTSSIHQNGSGFTFVKITPEITPENANSKIDYKVVNADKEDVTSDVVVGKKTAGEKVYAYNSDTAESIGANELGLKIAKAGTYTITATADDAEATMTLTVRDNFKDVPATAYYAAATRWAYANGVTVGTSNGNFGTNDPVTRAQYVTWLYKYAVSEDAEVAIDDDDVKSVFSDVPTTAFYAKAVQWAKENGITAGTSATTFSPDRTITRAEAIQMLWVAKGRPYAGQGQENEQTLKFTDIPNNAYYKTAVKWAFEHSITAGTSATTFGPNDVCRRSQAIQFIYKAQ